MIAPSASFADRLDEARHMLAAAESRAGDVPGWLRDQARAACAEAHAMLVRSSAALAVHGFQSATLEPVDDDEIAVRMLAAVLGCRSCPHVRKGAPRLMVADLNHRLVQCGRCCGTYRKPITDDRCEVCGEPAGPVFREFMHTVGAIVVVGNAGACCSQYIGEGAS